MSSLPHPVQAPAAPPALARAGRLSLAASPPAHDPMPTHDELNAWMEAVATRGDRQAFAGLFKHFAPRVKGYLVRSGCAPELAEDLTQEAMVTVWRRAATFDPARAAVSTWLFTIARNLRIDHHRRRATAIETDAGGTDPWDADLQVADPARTPEETLLAAQLERRVQRALSELPEEHVQVLRLSYYHEQPHARIAQELGIPLGTVKSRIRVAVARLRSILAQSAS